MLALLMLCGSFAHQDAGVLGYYRSPAIHGDLVVFCAEGDLWKVNASGGTAQRLTTHPSTESNPEISPDGKWLAFSASYEGPTEVYVMPLEGGLPTRCTYEGASAIPVGWKSSTELLYSTRKYSPLGDRQVCIYNLGTHARSLLPLAQASDGCFADDSHQFFFTRLAFQGSQTKRYKGGTAQNLWRWDGGSTEAVPLTPDFPGTSRDPKFWNGKVYFESDRDGVMNIWAMDAHGKNLKQLTKHDDFDATDISMDGGRIVYQHGADVWMLDVKTGKDAPIPIRLTSDFDQMRERWLKTPLTWTTSAHISPDGTRVVMTARGQVFVAPAKAGRIIEVTRNKGVRFRDAKFSYDGKRIETLSDESGEVELWQLGILGASDAKPEQLTTDGEILRLQHVPSPDGNFIAHTDKRNRLFLFDLKNRSNKLLASSDRDAIESLTWSSDSKFLAFCQTAQNDFVQIKIYEIASGKIFDAATDRFNNQSPAFTPDGKFLYFVSDRHLSTRVLSPWGPRAPEPYFDKQFGIYMVALQKGLRSPFEPDDELSGDKKNADSTKTIDADGLSKRLMEVPIPPGNYSALKVCGDRLYFLTSNPDEPPTLASVKIQNKNIKIDTILSGVIFFESTPDGKKILARTATGLYVFDANGAPPDASESRVNLDGWMFSFDPKEEWQQIFDEAWRLHRDFLYAPNMQGVDWKAMKAKYRPLAARVTDRTELSDVIAQMVGEISLLHTFVTPGDRRMGTDAITVASLGCEWAKTEDGYRISKIYEGDPDDLADQSPLKKPGVELQVGDLITEIDGVRTTSVDDASSLLRGKSGRQVRLKIAVGGDLSKTRDVIVKAVSQEQADDIRYGEWEYTRRLQVEQASGGEIGYLHLRAMGAGDMNQFARDFYPQFNKKGLIIDVRHNEGGNIDSWILEKLMRKAWMYWAQRDTQPYWNMQYAFRGHLVVLCDQNTASDGEAFSEGFRRLGLGKVIGMRTWGGEVWLTGSNTLVDRGVATAAEFGVYGPEGKWLIEGHGVDPDIVVDNLPRSTFDGEDAQLKAAIGYLKDEIAKHPVDVPKVPPYPNKALPKKGGGG